MSMSILGKIKIGDLVLLDWSDIELTLQRVYLPRNMTGLCEVVSIDECMGKDYYCFNCPGRIKLKSKNGVMRRGCWMFGPLKEPRIPFVSVFSKTDDVCQEINSEIDELLDF